MYKRILVPIDGSETSQRGLREAIALAKMLGAKLHLMHVISDYAVMVEMSSAIDFANSRAGMHQHGRDLLESTAAELALRESRSRPDCAIRRAAASPTRSCRRRATPSAI